MTTVNIGADGKPARRARAKPADRYHHGELRGAVLDLARRQLAQHGLEALSLRALARRLGVSHTAVYRHFTDRAALLDAVATAAMHDLAVVLEAAEATASAGSTAESVIAALEAVGVSYVQFACARAHEFRLMFSQETVPASRRPELRAANDRASAPVVRLTSRLIQTWRAHHESLAVELAVQIWALAHGTAFLLLERQLQEGVLRTPARPLRSGSEAGVSGVQADEGALQVLRNGIRRLLTEVR